MTKKTFLQRNKLEVIFSVLAISIVIIDQITKFIVLKGKPDVNLGILKINLVQNTGAGFGILKGWPLLLALVSLIVAAGVIFYYKKIPKKMLPQVLFGLFLGGVVGNGIDRLFRSYVIDFIDFGWWPAFNIADAAITISVIGLVIWMWKE